MKKLYMIITICLMLLVGCKKNTPSVNPASENNNAAQTAAVSNDNAKGTDTEKTDNDEQEGASSGEVIEIKEKVFIAQINDIYYNAEDYLGKTIKYEGVFDIYELPEMDTNYYSVIRYGPGCCGTDGNVGFEVVWDKGYPNANDWVEVVGVLEEYEQEGYLGLRLNLSSLTVLPTRGTENVSQ